MRVRVGALDRGADHCGWSGGTVGDPHDELGDEDTGGETAVPWPTSAGAALGIHPERGAAPEGAVEISAGVGVGCEYGVALGTGAAGCSGDPGLSDEVEGDRHGSIGGCDMAPL